MSDKKHELTEKLKVIETEIHEAKLDLRAINSKLEISMQYEDDLRTRQITANEKTKQYRGEFFKKSSEISDKYRKMANIFEMHTGNFYRD